MINNFGVKKFIHNYKRLLFYFKMSLCNLGYKYHSIILRNFIIVKKCLGQSSRGTKKYRKLKQKDINSTQLIDEEHWSRNNKYDGDLFLESNYRKHLSRHANK